MTKLIISLLAVVALASACATAPVQSIGPPQGEVSGAGGE